MRRVSIATVITVVAIYVSQSSAQPDASPDDARARQLATQLAGVDQAAVDRAINEIHTLLESDPDASAGFCRKYWLPSLIASSRSDQAERLAFDGILAAPWQTGSVEVFQEARVRMLLRTNRPAEALSNARSLFNVAALRGTEHALLLIAECLKAVHGQNAVIVRQFGKEQLAGATTRPETQIEPTSALMAEISIDASAYTAEISQIISDDDKSRRAKGNLLLLGGRCDEALVTFQVLKRMSESADRVGLIEDVARAMKASDGTIGRANGYVLSEARALKSD